VVAEQILTDRACCVASITAVVVTENEFVAVHDHWLCVLLQCRYYAGSEPTVQVFYAGHSGQMKLLKMLIIMNLVKNFTISYKKRATE
jgi:hypothetical protein